MKMVCSRFLGITLAVFLCLSVSATPLLAHDMWIEVRDFTPQPGEEITMVLGYDHYLPARGFLPEEYLDQIYLLNPKGKRINIINYSDVEYKTEKAPNPKGTHMVVAIQKGRFWTKTTEGYQSGKSKKGLKNVIGCTYSAKYGKAVVNVGAPSGDLYAESLGHDLEIVPLADPGTLRSEDMLPLKVMFRKKPLPGTPVLATYVGFSREKNTFAYATKTDAFGKAKIRVANPGAWLVTVHQKDDYPDTSECDRYSYAASLTFEIQ